MNDELLTKIIDMNNYAIFDGYAKALNVVNRSTTALCSISGGSDSDLVLDIIHNVDEYGKDDRYRRKVYIKDMTLEDLL